MSGSRFAVHGDRSWLTASGEAAEEQGVQEEAVHMETHDSGSTTQSNEQTRLTVDGATGKNMRLP